MPKIVLEINNKQIREIMEQLPKEVKIQLVKKWEDKFWDKRMEEILKKIDQRRTRCPIKDEEILKEIEKGRQEYYDQSSS